MNFRKGGENDLEQLRQLGLKSWVQFKEELTDSNWRQLFQTLDNIETYVDLLNKSACVVCENEESKIIGMAFLVPKGNPTDIYDEKWCHLRFVSVDPYYRGKRIGELLTEKCIAMARGNDEQTMALHTSEIMYNARHLYTKLGFKKVKEIEPRLGLSYWLYTLDLI